MKKIFSGFFISLIVVMLCVSLAACGPFEGYDDDKAIINGNSFSSVSSVSTSTPSKYSFSARKCNGVSRVKDITVPQNPVFDMVLNIKSGRFKVVLVGNNTVYLVCDYNTEEPVATADIPAGTYNLRLVAQDAEVKFSLVYNSYSASA